MIGLSITPTQAQEKGDFYVGGGLGFVVAGNTRADGVFSSTGSTFDGQRLGPEPGETASGKFNISPTFSVTVGYDLGKRRFGRFRVEGEVFHQKADTDSYTGLLDGSQLNPAGTVNTTMVGIAVNALYDLPEIAGTTPYVFLGLGRAQVDTNYDFPGRGGVDVDGRSEIIQGGFGTSIAFKERMDIDLKYRFRRAGLNEGGLDTDIDAHILEVGIRYPL